MPVKEVRQEEHRKQAGARVLALREAKRWTHEDLAHAAGLSVKTVSRFEKGRGEGRRTTLRKLAQALDVDEHDIIGPPPAPLGLTASEPQEREQLDRIEDVLKRLLGRQEAMAESLAALVEHAAADPSQGSSRRRRAS